VTCAFREAQRGQLDRALSGAGTGPVSYEDSISPEHFELERKAIFAGRG